MGIPLKKVAKRWMKEPDFKEGYDALDEEFSLASQLIEARVACRPHASRGRRAHGHQPIDSGTPGERRGQTEPLYVEALREGDGRARSDHGGAEPSVEEASGHTSGVMVAPLRRGRSILRRSTSPFREKRTSPVCTRTL